MAANGRFVLDEVDAESLLGQVQAALEMGQGGLVIGLPNVDIADMPQDLCQQARLLQPGENVRAPVKARSGLGQFTLLLLQQGHVQG